jgi:preprotein translocase subunit SecF
MAKCYWQSLISVVFFLSCASFSSPAFSESLDINSGVSRSSKKCVGKSTENCKKNSSNGQKKTNRSGSDINQGKPSGTNNSSKRRRRDDSANNSDRKPNQRTNSVSRKSGKKPAIAKSGDTQTNFSRKKRPPSNNVNRFQGDIDLNNQSPEPNNQPTPKW